MARLTKTYFGTTADGHPVDAWELQAGDYRAQFLTFGGILRSLLVPAGEGHRDVVLGCETLEEYERQDKYFGALVGRTANRIGGAAFSLNGRDYTLAANNGPNCLHGGNMGFDRRLWQATPRDGSLVLSYTSPDGEEGFPGTLEVSVTCSLTPEGTLSLDYRATTDADTPISLTCHAYFNLLGHNAGSLKDHQLQILADAFTPIDPNGLPTGEILPGEGPFRLQDPRMLLEGLAQDHPQLRLGNGYDHNFILHHAPAGPLRLAARASVRDLCLECYTTQPGLQLYTANFLDGNPGKEGASYGPRSAFCLETQSWPDAIHHRDFPSMVLRAGETYRQRTEYRIT